MGEVHPLPNISALAFTWFWFLVVMVRTTRKSRGSRRSVGIDTCTGAIRHTHKIRALFEYGVSMLSMFDD